MMIKKLNSFGNAIKRVLTNFGDGINRFFTEKDVVEELKDDIDYYNKLCKEMEASRVEK